MKKIFIFWFCLILLGSCSNPTAETNFYIWKTHPDLTVEEVRVFEKTNAKKIYIRFFDVAVSQGNPEPKAILKDFDPNLLSAEYVPVIFITNESFKNLSNSSNKEMAENIFNLIQRISSDFNIAYQEIQIDSDWTESTQENFFLFLKNLKNISSKKISSTLRLHQVKYRNQTGIPPVDKVYLMAYATSNPTENQDINSILDEGLLKDYLQNINDYPLDFDIALPIYSWAIVSNHLGRKKIINAVQQKDLENEDFHFENGVYVAQKDVFLKGFYVNKGFKIKLESISPELLNSTKTYLKKHIKQPYNIVYYHLDRQFTNQFNIEDL